MKKQILAVAAVAALCATGCKEREEYSQITSSYVAQTDSAYRHSMVVYKGKAYRPFGQTFLILYEDYYCVNADFDDFMAVSFTKITAEEYNSMKKKPDLGDTVNVVSQPLRHLYKLKSEIHSSEFSYFKHVRQWMDNAVQIY